MEAIAIFGPKHNSHPLSLPSRSNLFPVDKLSRFQVSGKHVRFKAIACASQESNRKFKKLPPSEWGHHFLDVPIDEMEMVDLEGKIEALKPKVRAMLMPSTTDVDVIKKRILLIYLLISLGLAYHFQDEIKENLKDGFEKIDDMMVGENDLYTVSTLFWVFRTYGHNMSSDVFKRFQGDDGEFKEQLIEDIKGMLSLYEATYVMTKSDDIMDKAMSFTSTYLKLFANRANPPTNISRLINNSLCIPHHLKPEMLFAREYISIYEKEEDHNKLLLEFAKLNFKFLQLNWIQELKILTKWWKEQDLASKLPPFFRDRLLEIYLFAFFINFEPKFSRERIIMVKIFIVLTLVDDACDRYGSVSEIAALAHCVERWDPNDTDMLPDYMKTIFKLAWEVYEGSAKELSYSVQCALDEFKLDMKANLKFAEWTLGDIVPTFDEYLEIGCVETGVYATLAFSFFGLGEIDRREGSEWLKLRPELVTALTKKARLLNDMTGFEDDTSRGYKVNAMNYYMRQYGVSKEETLRDFHRMVRDINKTVNEEYLKTKKIMSGDILSRVINVGKVTDVTYTPGEEFTNPKGKYKDYITSLFVNLILLC